MYRKTVVAVGLCFLFCAAQAGEVPKIIFDTDMTGDCDDCGALAVLHALADNGEVEILGCIASWGANPYVPGCIDAINTYYGRGDLPIGAEPDEIGRLDSRYTEAIAKNTARYGHDLVTKEGLPTALSVYRQILSEQAEGSVTIVTVGRLKGMADLLRSKPDALSALDGVSLVKKKVLRWVCMGGRYPNTEPPSSKDSGAKKGGEANFCTYGGKEYTGTAVESCPVPVVFSGYEIGVEVKTGPALMKDTNDNPAAEAYRLFFGGATEQSRPSWDQTAVLYAVRGAGPWWDLVSTGYNHIKEDGMNTWRPSPDKDHAYLVKRRSAEELTAVISTLMTQAPKRRATAVPDR